MRTLIAIGLAALMIQATTASVVSQTPGNEQATGEVTSEYKKNNTCHFSTCNWGPYDVKAAHRLVFENIKCASTGNPPPNLNCTWVSAPSPASYCRNRDGNSRCFCENLSFSKAQMTVKMSGC